MGVLAVRGLRGILEVGFSWEIEIVCSHQYNGSDGVVRWKTYDLRSEKLSKFLGVDYKERFASQYISLKISGKDVSI